MEKITINGSTSYDVLIEPGILNRLGALLHDRIGSGKALVVCDSNVSALYLDNVSKSLSNAGYEICNLILSPGEETKTIDNYLLVLNKLSEQSFSKSDLLIALGGGVIGDLAGFAAATFKRGIHFVQVPTTLLAAVDSSVGGKTAVDLPSGKNQVGIIRNPDVVICDPDVIKSLDEQSLLEGYAEIIKYAVLKGYDIIDSLRKAISSGDYSDVIYKSISIKREYIESDEGDNDVRQFLNLGHLIGHAIEASTDYEISHGTAVAYGLAIESKLCAEAGYTDISVHNEIVSLLHEFGFTLTRSFTADELRPFILQDKKIRANQILLIIPETIGHCTMRTIPVPNFIELL